MKTDHIHTPISMQQLCCIMYRKKMTFSKIEASKLVGGRTRLESLVAQGKIRAEKNRKLRTESGNVRPVM